MAGVVRSAVAVLVFVLGVATLGPSVAGASSASGQAADAEAGGGRQVVGTVTTQSFADGPNGTVFTLTVLETDDGETVTIRTHGGVRGDIVQVTSHEPEFAIGTRYAVQLAGPLDQSRAGGPTIYTVLGGERGATPIDADGNAIDESHNTPTNFVLQPYNWRWTLPDNPPVMHINPNTTDVGNEIALVQAALDTWEDDPGSAMDFTFGGTTSVNTVGNDGTNAIFWADTPDPGDTFLARTTTFFNRNSGNAVGSDILFNNDFRWVDGAASGSFDVLSVAIHELGHTLGLGHAPNQPAIMFFSISSNAVKRTLSLGDRGGVAVQYPVANAGQSVTGQVTFNDGAVAPDVRLNLFTENRAQFLAVDFTDGGGDYTFDLPASGCYAVTFIAPDGIVWKATGGMFQNRAFCADAGQTVTGIDAVLVAPGSETTSSGRVTFVDGSPAGNVRLNLFTENRGQFLAVDFTDANGNYTFNLPGAGCYVTTFIAPTGDTFVATGGPFQNAAYCAGEGQGVRGIDAQLVGAALAATFGGDVTDTSGGPVAGVRTVIYRANGDGSRGQWLGPTLTDANGTWSSTQAPGCYVIDMVAPGGRTWVATGSVFSQQSFCVAAGETLTTLDGVLN